MSDSSLTPGGKKILRVHILELTINIMNSISFFRHFPTVLLSLPQSAKSGSLHRSQNAGQDYNKLVIFGINS